jgi:hypothetical protein
MYNSFEEYDGDKTFKKFIGKTIVQVHLDPDDNSLKFKFSDNTQLKVYDDGQSCCEYRYMRTDDNLNDFVGSVLLGCEVKSSQCIEEANYSYYHEVQFFEVRTSKGWFTMCSHNEHNGYYGGFSLKSTEVF